MKSRKYLLLVVALAATMMCVQAQENSPYVPETDPLVTAKLSEWQDLKFGLMMHWGAYSQWGVVESWSICSEDEPWCARRGPYGHDYTEYKKQYERLQTTFNPEKFNPDRWVKAAKAAGMKYVVFTTKHHDGFCMFDSKYTDYKITAEATPFHSNPRANVAKEIFSAFSKENFLIGAYFSKPDWHCPDYWAPEWATPNRHVNYNTKKYPERWQKYKDFTFNQIEELMTGYGKIDILWLDGGWVRPFSSEEEEKEAAKAGRWNQDVDMARIAKMGRTHQPGLIVVDRSVAGIYENYRTPEQTVPDKPLSYPWETCMTMASSWSYVPHDRYKPAGLIIHLLVDIVAKGGNYLLNIGPGPDGEWHEEAYERLEEIGKWMTVNGEAIYGTRPVEPYKQDKVCYTSKGNTIYGIYLPEINEVIPQTILLKGIQAKTGAKVSLLGVKGNCKWRQTPDGVEVTVPSAALNNPELKYAWTVRIIGK